MSRRLGGAVAAVTLALITAIIALGFLLVGRSSLAEPSFEIDEAEGKAKLDSRIVFEVRGSFSEDEIRKLLEFHPPIPIGDVVLTVERIAEFPWQEWSSLAKTRVTINPEESRLFEPETIYTVVLNDETLTFETITLPRVVDARVGAAPEDDFDNVATSTPIVLTFNEEVVWRDEWLDVDPAVDMTTATEVSPGGGTELWLVPARRWENSTTYTVTVQDGVMDVFGHAGVEPFSIEFTTWPRPTVVDASPTGDDLAPDAAVRVEFERPVDRSSVEGAFEINPPAPGHFEWAGDRVLEWKPSGLLYSTRYLVSVGGTDAGGDPIVPSQWSFSIRSQPKVVEALPAGDSVPEDSSVRLQFDRQVIRDTVEESFQVEPDVPGTFEWENDRVMTWRPAELAYSTGYTVSVSGMSSDGDPLVPHEWSFTTRDPPAYVAIHGSDQSPTLIRAVPSGGIGEYSYVWSSGETSQEIQVDVWYGEVRTLEVTVFSGDRSATAELLVVGPPSPCPEGWQVITREVCYHEEVLPGPVQIFLTRVDLRSPDVQLRSAPAPDFLGMPSTVSKSALARDTLVSINGDFFDLAGGEYYTGGPMVSGGNVVYAPGLGGIVFALDSDLKSWVGRAAEFEVYVNPTDGERQRLGTINEPPGADGLALFNAYWGERLSLDANGCYALFVPTDPVTNTAYQSSCGAIDNVPLATGEFALIATGEAAEWMSQNIEQPLSISTSFPLPEVEFVVGGSHVLLRDGEPGAASLPGGRHPRTAIGIDGEGFVYLVVVDGRSSISIGMSLAELQTYLDRLGLVNAINLDGGGSSTMVVQGSVMNTPSGGRERAVAGVVEFAGRRASCWYEFVRC